MIRLRSSNGAIEAVDCSSGGWGRAGALTQRLRPRRPVRDLLLRLVSAGAVCPTPSPSHRAYPTTSLCFSAAHHLCEACNQSGCPGTAWRRTSHIEMHTRPFAGGEWAPRLIFQAMSEHGRVGWEKIVPTSVASGGTNNHTQAASSPPLHRVSLGAGN